MSARFARNIGLFGEEGQQKIGAMKIAVVGAGGLGLFVIQELALLGVKQIGVVDYQDLDETNLNRYPGVRHDDPIPGMPKVNLAERLVQAINPNIEVVKVLNSLLSEAAFSLIKAADYVFGCVDKEGLRLVLTELCVAYDIPYIDLASDVNPGPPISFGGTICVAKKGQSCLSCLDVLDVREAQEDLMSLGERRAREAIYGVDRQLLSRSGPSVVSINGVVASLAVTEFMVDVTGLREPNRLMTYYGTTGKTTVSINAPCMDCYYCKHVRGKREKAEVERYLVQDSRA